VKVENEAAVSDDITLKAINPNFINSILVGGFEFKIRHGCIGPFSLGPV